MKKSANELKRGDFVEHNGEIWQVIKTDFNYRGRGSATVRVKLKNILSGTTIENTTKSDIIYNLADIEPKEMQFLYKDGVDAFFMEARTFEQVIVPLQRIGQTANYLKEGDRLYIIMHNGVPLSIRPPTTVTLRVDKAEEAARGDTATAPKKSVILETGVSVKVPLFIKKGDRIIVNPETGEYVERAN